MLLNDKKIAIIGGGPGGLTLARLLQQKGIVVKVYERDFNKNVRVQGATLDLHADSGLLAVEAAGLMSSFKKAYRPGADKGRVMDKFANIVFDEHQKAVQETDFSAPTARPEIDRSDLRDMLLNSLEPDTVVWDSHFVNMTQIDSQWKIEFRNGTTAFADIVVGADGGSSKIRPFVTAIKSFYAGIYILQGNVEDSKNTAPNIHQLLKGGKIYVHSDNKFLHVSSKGDGSIDFYVSSKRNESWAKESGIDFSDKMQLRALFQKEFAGWNSIWSELFENFELPLLIRPQYCVPADQAWDTHSNLTLVGDAAHIMAPSGEGVNLAMLDALALSECLTNGNFKDVRSAIAGYEKQMLARSAEEANTSMELIEWMYADGAQDKLIAMISSTLP